MALTRTGIVLAAVALIAGSPATAQVAPAIPAAGSQQTLLRKIFADDTRREESLDPLATLYRGEDVEPAALSELYTDALARKRLQSARASLAALIAIDRSALSLGDQISYDVFAFRKREEIALLQPDIRALTGVRPFNHFGGFHVEFPTLMSIDGAVAYADEADYSRALRLDASFAAVIDNAIARFREGVSSGVVETRLTVGNMIGQIDALLAQPVEESPFFTPVLDFPQTIPERRRTELREAYATVIRERIYPAYRRLRAFLADEYLPVARAQVGLSAMSGGSALYRRLIERETTLALDPGDVHRLGLAEVARIRREMEGVKRELDFAGPLRDFFEHVRTDPRYHPASRDELERGFERIGEAVDRQVPRFFLRRPGTPLVIQAYPDYRGKYEPGGSYNQGSADATRPGIFYYNAYDLPSRFLTGMATLYLHEAVPGHHFQISLAQENSDLPSFQRFDGNSAFVEGWALYAETLGYEMGLYEDPMQHWGTLDDEMLRAMRLVVDTGLHAGGWSRDQAIDYMLANSGMSRTDATAEVERYIAYPAQALSYKIGALTIQRLRREAEAALGAGFDIRAFHEQVLGSGALPLPILEAKIARWIAASR